MEVLVIAVALLLVPRRALAFGIAEALAITSAAKHLFGGGGSGGRTSALQEQIGRAMLDQFRKDQAIRQPFQRDLSRSIRSRSNRRLPLSQVSLPRRANPFAAGNRGTSTSSIAPGANRVGSFLRQRAAVPTQQ